MKKILVIEDDTPIRENTAELLALDGFEVITAENGRAGYSLAAQQLPDLILCDMMMPETDGRGFLNLVNNNKLVSSIPIIFFSAGTVPQHVHQLLVNGSAGFLRKPFLSEDLIAMVHGVLD